MPPASLNSMVRRQFLLGNVAQLAALATLLREEPAFANPQDALLRANQNGGLTELPHFTAKAKRIVFLTQSGAPSQVDLFDYKPELTKRHGEELPATIREGQRLTTMTADQPSKPLTASPFAFAQHGQSAAWVSELMPFTAKVADQLCFIRTCHTDAINHDPAITFLQTGSQHPGRPSMGAWVSYGLGSLNENLPTFVVLLSGGQPGDQPLYGRLWGSGFLPGQHQGTRFLSGKGIDPVPYLSNPKGVTRESRERLLAAITQQNTVAAQAELDPSILARTKQYELAFRMQAAIPRVTDLQDEPAEVFKLYGEEARTPGTYAANCLLARRMLEQGVRFVQLYHRDWDHHTNLPKRIRERSLEVDQPSAALVSDLARRGLLEDTLIVWAGEFGRTSFCQGELVGETYGRDHHPRCFTLWMAGGGVKPGIQYGTTDDFSYNVTENPVHVHDLQATILHLLGIEHKQFTYRFAGRDFRLTDIAGEVVRGVLR